MTGLASSRGSKAMGAIEAQRIFLGLAGGRSGPWQSVEQYSERRGWIRVE